MATPQPMTGAERLQQWRLSRMPTLLDDFGELARYREANAALQPPAPRENWVVFFGDSITDMWKLDLSFPGKPYVNRGISGQTTPQTAYSIPAGRDRPSPERGCHSRRDQ
jgi:hypothetical protein